MSWKTSGEVRAWTYGTKSPSRPEALRFIDSSKSPFGRVDKAQCFRSARRFGAVGSSPDFSRDFSRHGAPRPLSWTFFQCTLLSYPGQPSYSQKVLLAKWIDYSYESLSRFTDRPSLPTDSECTLILDHNFKVGYKNIFPLFSLPAQAIGVHQGFTSTWSKCNHQGRGKWRRHLWKWPPPSARPLSRGASGEGSAFGTKCCGFTPNERILSHHRPMYSEGSLCLFGHRR